ncbi:MAG TPA: TonB-dependent receptor [Acidobacteriaceae bacterium]|nr:TonB-dependent receptor [Acidobacteriaceae bacterium]
MKTIALRLSALLFVVSLLPAWQVASACATAKPPVTAPAPLPAFTGTVTDGTGAIVPGAEVRLLAADGTVAATAVADADGSFRLQPAHPGQYTVSVTMSGFQSVTQSVHAATTATVPLSLVLTTAMSVQQVTVNASTSVDLTSSDSNGDTAVMTSDDLKDLPVFDNDYVTAMGAFLDSGDTATAGTGLMVDGVEANRAMVSPSAVQEVHINQDPYSARYYRPGRGQIEIITRQAERDYHGQFNFLFRDSDMNAQQEFSPSKPFEQRRIYEGNVTGPVLFAPKSAFLFSFNRAEEDLDAVVNATIAPTPDNPDGIENLNVPAPTRDTEFSLRVGHQFSDSNNAYVMYAFQDSSNQNEGVGNQTLPEAGYNNQYREDDLTFHDDYVVSADTLNQASLVLERTNDPITDVQEGPQINVNGNFIGGSAQDDQVSSEYNLRANEMITWTHGKNLLKYGLNLPHFSRRVFDDHTDEDGTYSFSPTYAPDGTLTATAIQEQQAGDPSAYSIKQGQTRFVYHQQEVGAFVQDQIKLAPRFSITPGLRYDWQNFLPGDVKNFSPRFSFALVLDQKHEVVLRGGGGIYFDRIGSSPLLDIARYQDAKLRLLQISANQQPLCYPISDCLDASALPPSVVERAPGLRTPYQIQYGVLIERKVGEKGNLSVGGRVNKGVDVFRSIDLNAPLGPDFSTRPDPNFSQMRQMQSAGAQKGAALDINYRGRFNKRFTGFAWYSLSHYGNNTSGIWWFPEQQQNPNADWGPADWDQRQHFGVYAMLNPQHVLNLGVGVFANSGRPWTVLTGTDAYGDNLFNARPDGVARNSEIGPDYSDLDLRWGYDFKLHPKELDRSPTVGVSVSSFDALNHPNGSYVDTVEGSPDFAQVTSSDPPRRTQLGMRFNF